jgi:precorrin-6A/cobalt-precorrin-6A reductase
MRILILGGTLEARQLGERLACRAGAAVTLSLAGRTASPAPQAVPIRTGRFGGTAGLADYLKSERIDVLIDATHPYATIISVNAAQAAQATGVRFLALRRSPWLPEPGDRWLDVETMPEAVSALGATPRRVFLALGRKDLVPFEAAPQHHYLIRSVDPVWPPLALPKADYVTARGPFREIDERKLLSTHAIDTVVAKNSGGAASYGKIGAARALGLSVIILRRPPLPPVSFVETVEEVFTWLDHGCLPDAVRGV